MGDMHEFEHPGGLTLRVPKGFALGKFAPDVVLQLTNKNGEHIEFPTAYLEDLYRWLQAMNWAEAGAITPASGAWPKFVKLVKKGIKWKCIDPSVPRYKFDCDHDGLEQTTSVLAKNFGEDALQETLSYLQRTGAKCDCDILFKIDHICENGWRWIISEQLPRRINND